MTSAKCRNCPHPYEAHFDYLVEGSMLCWTKPEWVDRKQGYQSCNCPGYRVRRLAEAKCLVCGGETYFAQRSTSVGVGIGLWCLLCEKDEVHCVCVGPSGKLSVPMMGSEASSTSVTSPRGTTGRTSAFTGRWMTASAV